MKRNLHEIMVRERFLRSGKKVYEYSFEMASVDGKRKRKSKSGFASKMDARIAGRKELSEYENVRLSKAFQADISPQALVRRS